jgi:hypothetical protein
MIRIAHFRHFLMYLHILILLSCTFRLVHGTGHPRICIGDHTRVSGMQLRARAFISSSHAAFFGSPFFQTCNKGVVCYSAQQCAVMDSIAQSMHSRAQHCTVHAQFVLSHAQQCTVARLNCTVHAQSGTALHSPCTVRTESCAAMHSRSTQLHS